jgi:hypothetical protein
MLPLTWPAYRRTAAGRRSAATLLRNFISFYHQAYRAAVWSYG